MAITVDFRVLKKSIKEMGASLCHYPVNVCERKPFKLRPVRLADKETPQDTREDRLRNGVTGYYDHQVQP
jgi:hypothetical protein